MKTRQPKNHDLSKSKLIRIISSNVKHYRMIRDISQETLAEYANLHRNSICLLEKGELNLTLTTLESISEALNITAIQLLSNTILTTKK
jgi:transcriptional regulator with XRE-family HTH domain